MYLSISGQTVTQKTIEKSRFITTSRHVESEEEAKDFISEISAKYRDATHNCYAYVCDETGNFLRFSDDGEPQGTAGMPMLEVLKTKKLFQIAAVVTRYFGGIKLGAGGLARAYSGSVSENLDTAQKVLYQMCSESKYTVGYSGAETAARFFSEFGAEVKSVEYLNEVHFVIAVKKENEYDFNSELLNRLNGKVEVLKLKEYYYPFKI